MAPVTNLSGEKTLMSYCRRNKCGTHADHTGRSLEASNVFACSNTEVMGSNRTQGTNVCMCVCARLFRVCVGLCVGTSLAKG
jgi:hypothetical protein